MTMQFRDIAAQTAANGAITPEDVLALRRVAWADGAISADEAQAIFALNARIANPAREWVDFFVEALSVWLVDEQSPKGYIDEAQARWLVGQMTAGGPRATPAELELIAHCLEKAISTPDVLRTYALEQLEATALDARRITGDEVKLLRRVLFAAGNDRPAGVSQREAEMLFRIKDATLGADNAPEWQQLFVQGVGNYLMGFSGSAPLSRAREAELESFMNQPAESVGGLFGRMLGHHRLVNGFTAAIDYMETPRAPEEGFAAEAKAAARITPEEQGWLSREMEADGKRDPLEQALLDFIAEEQGR